MTILIVTFFAVANLAFLAAMAFALIVISIQIVDHSSRLTSEPSNFLDAATRRLLGCPRHSGLHQTKES